MPFSDSVTHIGRGFPEWHSLCTEPHSVRIALQLEGAKITDRLHEFAAYLIVLRPDQPGDGCKDVMHPPLSPKVTLWVESENSGVPLHVWELARMSRLPD